MHISVYLLPNLNYCMISLIVRLHVGQVQILVVNILKTKINPQKIASEKQSVAI